MSLRKSKLHTHHVWGIEIRRIYVFGLEKILRSNAKMKCLCITFLSTHWHQNVSASEHRDFGLFAGIISLDI